MEQIVLLFEFRSNYLAWNRLFLLRSIIYLNLITGGKILHPSRVSSNRQAPTLENTVADMLDAISQVADHHVKNVVGKRRLSLQ